MPGSVLAVLLGFSLVLVYYWRTRKPLPKRPLNVDKDLPLPWLAQTSTVFSLTGLFGAYFGIAVTLGLPALTGLAFGTVLGLFLVRYWIDHTLKRVDKKGEKRFEDFLSELLKENNSDTTAYAVAISGVQCIFATSELLILRQIAEVALGLKSEQATMLAIGVAVLGYFYVLLGGYVALFRTDVIQLFLVCSMAVVSSLVLVSRHSQIGWTTDKVWPRPDFWTMAFLGSGRWLYLYHFVVATVMGLGLFLASPDTWKRIFQVNKDSVSKAKHTQYARVLTLLGVGVLPYLVLLPFAITIGMKSDTIATTMQTTGPAVKKPFTLPPALYDIRVFVVVALGLVASFLSSFNSALLGSVHVALIWDRKAAKKRAKKTSQKTPEEARFYQIIMATLMCICLIFLAARLILGWYGFNNPWLLGNLLMGGYAVIAGVHLGTGGNVSRLPKYTLQGIFVVSLVVWVTYFALSPGFSKIPTIRSVNTVPAGIALCLVIAVFSGLMVVVFGGRKCSSQ